MVVLDDLLTQEALAELRAVCLESSFWNSAKRVGYIGAYIDDGFTPAVIGRLAEQLESMMPSVFANHSLLMTWGYKYDVDGGASGIRTHADKAAVNLNFWITEDSANLDPDSGGIVVYKKRMVGPGSHADYNNIHGVT